MGLGGMGVCQGAPGASTLPLLLSHSPTALPTEPEQEVEEFENEWR